MTEKKLSILITTWGKPWTDVKDGEFVGFFWDPVTYILGSKYIVARDPLKLLLEHFKPNKVLILVCDTALKPSGAEIKFLSEIDNPKTVEELLELRKQKWGYFKHISDVEECYRKFIDEEIGASNELREGKIQIRVLPNVGKYPEGKFEGEPRDIYPMALYYISEFILDVLHPNVEEVEIILDTTHGINYIPSIVYSAVLDIAKLLAYGFNKVKIVLINSDPYIRNVTKELNVRKIADLYVLPDVMWLPKFEGAVKLISTPKDAKAPVIKAIKDGFKSVEFESGANVSKTKGVFAFLVAVKYGAPLAIFLLKPNKETLRSLLMSIETLYWAMTAVRKDSESEKVSLKITRSCYLTPQFDAYVRAYVLSGILDLLEFKGKLEVPFDELKSLSRKFYYKSKNSVLNALVSNEIRSIENAINSCKESGFVGYGEVLKKHVTGSGRDPRIFFAHAGMPYDMVEINPSNKVVRYAANKISEVVDVLF